MKLQRFKEKNKKQKVIIIFTITCVLLITGVFLYKTFASFQVIKNEDLINGDVSDPGDIYFAFYKDNKIQKEMPTKEQGYVLDEEKSYCGITGGSDSNIKVHVTEDNMIHVSGVTTSRTKCNLYFVKGIYLLGKGIPFALEGEDGLYEVKHDDVSGTLNDEGFAVEEYRYAGSNPNNYIRFNDEDWRIIGLVNVMTDENNTVEQRVKIVKKDTIGMYSWDSCSNVNYNRGINEWSQADANILLNDFYYNSKNGQTCYISFNNQTSSCDFNSIGIKEKTKLQIEEVIWNTGAVLTTTLTFNDAYKEERSTQIGKTCLNSDHCNDDIERTYKWKGNIALMYPSDYGYSISDKSCSNLSKEVESSYGMDCRNHSWISFSEKTQWLLSPGNNKNEAYVCFALLLDGRVVAPRCYYGNSVGDGYIYLRPALYLKNNVKIKYNEKDGSLEAPYDLQQIL